VSSEYEQTRPHLSRQQIYRRRRIVVFGLLAVLVATGVYVPSALAAPLEAAQPEVRTIEPAVAEAASVEWPDYGRGAIGLADGTGVLSTNGVEDPGVIASVTKIVTNLVVLQEHPLAPGEDGPSVTMTQTDVDLWNFWVADNASVQPVAAGTVFTQRELMELSLVSSAANYTNSLIVWAYGDMETFLAAARTWLDANGLGGVQLEEGVGLAPGNTATASDLVALARIALADPTIAEIAGTTTAEVPLVGTIENTNTVLGVGGVTGLKTGYTTEAGYNLLFSATVDVDGAPVTLVGALLGGPSRTATDQAVVQIVASAAANLHRVTAVEAGAELGDYETEWGAATTATAAEAATALVWGDAAVTVSIDLEPVATAEQGERIGTVTVSTPGVPDIEIAANAAEALEDPGAFWRLTNPVELFTT